MKTKIVEENNRIRKSILKFINQTVQTENLN